MKKILDIALKDLVRSYRSFFSIGMMFVAPLLITGLMYFAFSGMMGNDAPKLPDFKVVVVNHDQVVENAPRLGEMMVEFLQDERMPDWLLVQIVPTDNEAFDAVNRQQAGAALIIPADFSQSLFEENQQFQLTIFHDPTLTIGPQILSSLISQFIDGISGSKIAVNVVGDGIVAQGGTMNLLTMQQIAEQYSTWYAEVQRNIHHAEDPVIAFINPGSDAAQVENPLAGILGNVMAGMLVFFSFFSSAYSAQSILQEDEEGTLARLFTTPTQRAKILAGKFGSVWLTVIVQSTVLLVLSGLIFQISWGKPLSVGLVLLGLSVSSSGFGLLLVSLMKNSKQAGPVVGGVLSAFGMIGGLFTTAVNNMPPVFNTINLFTPQGWALRGLKVTLAQGSSAEIAMPLLVMLAMGVVLFAAGSMIFQRRFA